MSARKITRAAEYLEMKLKRGSRHPSVFVSFLSSSALIFHIPYHVKNYRINKERRMQQHQEEAEENRKRREERSMRRKQYAKALSQVPLIPCGGIEEYERIRGYEPGTVELLDIGGQNKGVVFYLSSRTLGNTNPVLYDDCTEHLIDAGLDGLIVRSSNMHYHHPAYYCLPVRKINPTNTAE